MAASSPGLKEDWIIPEREIHQGRLEFHQQKFDAATRTKPCTALIPFHTSAAERQ